MDGFNPDREWLLKASFENNLAWLRSFGCRVDAFADRVSIWHDTLKDFRALVVLAESNANPAEACREALLRAAGDGLDIYLDQHVAALWAELLTAQGYVAVEASDVRVLRTRPTRERDACVRVERADLAAIDSWSALYATVFDRSPQLSRLDRERWRLAASSSCMAHFFFVRDGARAGVCQLCESDGIAGLYSVGFLSSRHTPSFLRKAVEAIAGVAASHGFEYLYFERARRSTALAEPARRAPGPGRVLRTYEMWRSAALPVEGSAR